MPKPRKSNQKKRPVYKRLLIVCEGEKTEPNYFNRFIADCCFRGRQIEVRVVNSKRTTPKELINEAKKHRAATGKAGQYLDDQIWVVYDKNGYNKHQEACDLAKKNKIEIAFSSISFEFWILLHFEDIARPFSNSNEVIKYIEKKEYLKKYDKTDFFLYEKIKEKTDDARERARRIRQNLKNDSPSALIFNHNPYTNVDELLDAILKLKR